MTYYRQPVRAPIYYRNPVGSGFPYEFPIAVVLAVIFFFLFCA